MSVLPVGIGSEEAAGGYQIERSLRFNSADSAYLNRTPASAGNRKTWTWSGWVKRTGLSSWGYLIDTDSTNGQNYIHIDATTGQLRFYTSNGAKILLSTSVYRDPSSWYHIVGAIDTTQATESDRVKLYVNGVRITSFATEQYPAQNADLAINSTQIHNIGRRINAGTPERFFDGYMTEINFIDGSALDPTSFGEFNEDTGVWQPKAYTGSYGTNGFYLDFSDNTSTTTLGYDAAGSNDWTLNNFSVTAGVGNDSLVDSPTRYGTDTGAGGEVRGSYCTLNPLDNAQGATLSNGNLQAVNVGNDKFYRATFGMSSGKWYWEVQFGNLQNRNRLGITDNTLNASGTTLTGDYSLVSTGNQSYNTSTGSTPTVPTFATNDYICFAFDADAGTLYFEKNATPNISTSPKFTGMSTAKTYFVTCQEPGTASTNIFNFGQRPFSYAAPTGFKALVTTNLPEPTIADGSQYFKTVLYTGNGGTQSVTVGFAPDFVWAKNRVTTGYHHDLYDRVRGNNLRIFSSQASAETTGYLQFASNGFDLSAGGGINASGEAHVAWNWKAGGSGVTNTNGSTTSTVSASTDSGFSIVTWTGTGSLTTVGHGLGAVPKFIMVKNRTNGAQSWHCYSAELGNNAAIFLDLTAASTTGYPDWWNYTNPTSSVFTVNTSGGVNQSGASMVAYCFAPVAGYSAFGKYTGNGSNDGTFVYTGFRPAFVLLKISSGTDSWWMMDSKRDTYNVVERWLYANSSGAEVNTTWDPCDFLSNGFKLRANDTGVNGSGSTYIYMAFAENPFAYSLAR